MYNITIVWFNAWCRRHQISVEKKPTHEKRFRRNRMLEQLAYSTIRLVKIDTMHRLLFDNQNLPPKVRLLRSRIDMFVAFFYRYVIPPGLRTTVAHSPPPTVSLEAKPSVQHGVIVPINKIFTTSIRRRLPLLRGLGWGDLQRGAQSPITLFSFADSFCGARNEVSGAAVLGLGFSFFPSDM